MNQSLLIKANDAEETGMQDVLFDEMAMIYVHTYRPALARYCLGQRLPTPMETRVLEGLASERWMSIIGLLHKMGDSKVSYGYLRRLLTRMCRSNLVMKWDYGKYCLPISNGKTIVYLDHKR